MIIISPHLDDAVFSCGALLGLRGGTIVTICAGVPPAGTPPSWVDERAGFTNAAEAMEHRREEDRAAAEWLGVGVRHLDYLDCAYAHGQSFDDAIEEALEGVKPGARVLSPLGLVHPDHEATAVAFGRHAHRFDSWLYQELPYAVGWPEQVSPAIARRGCAPRAATVACSAEKRAAMERYPTQLIDTDLSRYHGLERYHPC